MYVYICVTCVYVTFICICAIKTLVNSASLFGGERFVEWPNNGKINDY